MSNQIKEIHIQQLLGKYIHSVDADVLKEVANKLSELSTGKNMDKELYEKFKDNLKSYMIRTIIKFNLIMYLESSYSHKRYTKSLENIQKLSGMIDPSYTQTLLAKENSIKYLERLDRLCFNFSRYKGLIADENGNRKTDSKEDLAEVVTYCDQFLDIIHHDEYPNPFFDGAIFVDTKNHLIESFGNLKKMAQEFYEDIDNTEANEFIIENCEFVSNLVSEESVFFPVINMIGEEYANTIVVSTPFKEEAFLAAKYLEIMHERKFVHLIADKLNNQDLDNIFNFFKIKKYDLAISNLAEVKEPFQSKLIIKLVEFSCENHYVLIIDPTGSKALYDDVRKTSISTGRFTRLDVSHVYLPLPNLNDIVREFYNVEGIEITNDMTEKIKVNWPFAGYLGINEAVIAYRSGRDWYLAASNISKKNEKYAVQYMNFLPSQSQLLDNSWGEYNSGDNYITNETQIEFDYDNIRDIKKENIDLIMNHKTLPFFAKCGIVIQYSLLGGDDRSRWEDVPIGEKKERVSLAFKLIYRLLGIPFIPEIEYPETNNDEGWGAQCCRHGELIKIVARNLDNYNFLRGTIAHESHHTFQFYAMDHAYNPDWWRDQGLTKNMVEQWKFNREKYYGAKSEYYRIQVTECESFAFEDDCNDYLNMYWNTIDFL